MKFVADASYLMIINYQDGWYVLESNTEQSRREWIGMDLPQEELVWLLRGSKTFSEIEDDWMVVSNSKSQVILRKKENELRIHLDDYGRIIRQEKT